MKWKRKESKYIDSYSWHLYDISKKWRHGYRLVIDGTLSFRGFDGCPPRRVMRIDLWCSPQILPARRVLRNPKCVVAVSGYACSETVTVLWLEQMGEEARFRDNIERYVVANARRP